MRVPVLMIGALFGKKKNGKGEESVRDVSLSGGKVKESE